MAALKALFTEDVRADYGIAALHGGDAVAAFLADTIAAGSAWMVHNIHSPLIEVDGDSATGNWTVNVRTKRTGIGAVDLIFGRYADRFRRVEGAWKIAAIAFDRYE